MSLQEYKKLPEDSSANFRSFSSVFQSPEFEKYDKISKEIGYLRFENQNLKIELKKLKDGLNKFKKGKAEPFNV